MKFEYLKEYLKELKTLSKKYKSLPEDMDVVKKILATFPNARPPFSFELDSLRIKECLIKVKKIACKSLKGKGVNTGLHLIYAYFANEQRIVFVEIYHKSDKPNEDRDRIRMYFK
jgi:mRNA-degrading endonuclease RelE of RelBE toxin-antitoxin system